MTKILLYFYLVTLFLVTSFVSIAQSCNLAIEGFETATTASPPAGWQINGAFIGTATPCTGLRHLGFNSLDDEIITPPFNCPSSICFYYRASAASSNTDLEIAYSDNNALSWIPVQTIYLIGEDNPLVYQQICIDLPEQNYNFPNNSSVLIRLKQTRRAGGSFNVDDICITSGICSVTPTRTLFSQYPTYCLQSNTNFSTTVCVTDAQGKTDHSFNGTITISKSSGAGNLQGITTLSAVQGCANFSNISFSTGGNYILQATASNGLTGISNTIFINNACPTTDTLLVMTYNTLNFPTGRNDCGATNLVIPARWDTLRKIVQYVQPDVLMICELHSDAGADSILKHSLNVNTTKYKRAKYYVNRSSNVGVLNTTMFYNSQKMELIQQDQILTNERDINKFRVYLHDPNLINHLDTTFIDFYEAHLKAGSFATDETDRANECDSIRQYIDRDLTPRNSILGGDFNLYTSTELAYQTLLSGVHPFNDPINTLGNWGGRLSFATTHTHSSRDTFLMDCGSTGGMNDRFDFLLVSNSILSGANHIQYIPNTYQPLGNNGTVYNKSINAPSNTSGIPDSVLKAMFYMSDHIPVLMKLAVNYPVPSSLPIRYIDLNVQAQVDGNYLTFLVPTNIQIQELVIERSKDGVHFETIATLSSNNTTLEHFLDKNPTFGTSYYRIKAHIALGITLQSRIVSVENTIFWDTTFFVYPNPSVNTLNLQVNNSKLSFETYLSIYNSLGQLVFYSNYPIQVGKNTLPLDISSLPYGLYSIHIEWIYGDTTLRFIKN